jgi:hypothetical protein
MANKQLTFLESFPLKPKNVLSSLDVITMNIQERGIYFTLLFISWIQPRQCYLKNDDEAICKLCNITPEEWQIYRAKVLNKFVQTDDGFMYNKVLLDVWHEEQAKEKKETKKARTEQISAIGGLIAYTFDEFWNDYDKKVGSKDRILPKWLKLTDDERERIRQDIPKRKAAQPNKQYRPNPETYLNGKLWNNEIINYTVKQNTNTNEQKTPDYDKQGSAPI